MAKTYQTYLYGASFGVEENGRILDGWQLDRNNILFQSKEYENPTDAMQVCVGRSVWLLKPAMYGKCTTSLV